MKCISPILSSMRGKLGGAVFSRARGAEITCRALAIPRNPNTFLQRAVRNAAISLSTRWRDVLTEIQQESWWDLASGSQTGKGIYVALNQIRAYAAAMIDSSRAFLIGGGDPVIDVPILDDPPAVPAYTDPFGPSCVIDDSANNLALTVPGAQVEAFSAGTAAGTPACLLVYASHQQSAGALSRKHPMALIACLYYTDPEVVGTSQNIPLGTLGFTTQAGKVMYVQYALTTAAGAHVKTGEERITIVA